MCEGGDFEDADNNGTLSCSKGGTAKTLLGNVNDWKTKDGKLGGGTLESLRRCALWSKFNNQFLIIVLKKRIFEWFWSIFDQIFTDFDQKSVHFDQKL